MLRRIGLVFALALVAAAVGGASAANAQSAGLTCVFEGLAGALSPGIQTASRDLSLPIDVEQGTFVFQTGSTSSALCAFGVDGVGVSFTATIHSQGYYDNIVCSTGWAHDLDGNATTVTGQDPVTGRTFTFTGFGYDIDFRHGVGDLRIGPSGTSSRVGIAQSAWNAAASSAPSVMRLWPNHTGGSGGTTDVVHGNYQSSWTGDGEVDITPGNGTVPPSDNCVNDADGTTDMFQVKGHFTARPN